MNGFKAEGTTLLTKKADGNKEGTQYGRRQPKFWFGCSLLTRSGLILSEKPPVVTCPQRVCQDADDHANENSEKRRARLPEDEAMIVLEHERECTKEQVQNPKQDGRERAEA